MEASNSAAAVGGGSHNPIYIDGVGSCNHINIDGGGSRNPIYIDGGGSRNPIYIDGRGSRNPININGGGGSHNPIYIDSGGGSRNPIIFDGGGSHNPIYISDEDDERRPEDVAIQEGIILSLDSSRAAITPSASGSASSAIHPPDRKGKCKLSSEDIPSHSKKQPSRRDHFECAICFEKVHATEKFLVTNCYHAFCTTCIGRYVAAKVGDNVAMIGCPDTECKNGSVEIGQCQRIIPSELFDRWNVALCENIIGGDKFYCPFKDCSALLINDGALEIKETECPHCHRLFCASCRVPWHRGMTCSEFKRLGDDEKGQDDLALKDLANKKKWQRCPKCKMYVERIEGCVYIVCRCRHCFCYLCGSPMTKGDHHCSKCKRTW